MARYDYDDGHTPESDDQDADEFSGRVQDYPPARRDSLMQRRLRAARGEEAEPDAPEDRDVDEDQQPQEERTDEDPEPEVPVLRAEQASPWGQP